jgi:hypothetical protein
LANDHIRFRQNFLRRAEVNKMKSGITFKTFKRYILIWEIAYSVLVDDIDDGRDLASKGTLLDDGNPTDLDKLLERLKSLNKRKIAIKMNLETNV